MKKLIFFIVCSLFISATVIYGNEKMQYDDSCFVYKLKPYDDEALAHYILPQKQ